MSSWPETPYPSQRSGSTGNSKPQAISANGKKSNEEGFHQNYCTEVSFHRFLLLANKIDIDFCRQCLTRDGCGVQSIGRGINCKFKLLRNRGMSFMGLHFASCRFVCPLRRNAIE